MSVCTIAFCLANLYVNVEVANVKAYETPNRVEGYWCGANGRDRFCTGPQVTLKVGMPISLGRDDMLIYYGFKHMSFPSEAQDKGQNSLFLSFTWMPFR